MDRGQRIDETENPFEILTDEEVNPSEERKRATFCVRSATTIGLKNLSQKIIKLTAPSRMVPGKIPMEREGQQCRRNA
jgi:hypothetical protein